MDVAKLRDESRVIANVMIEVAILPERHRLDNIYLLPPRENRHAGFQQLHNPWKGIIGRFVDQQMYVFGHYDVPEYMKANSTAHLFQGSQKGSFHAHLREQGKATITTECEEMSLPGMMKTYEPVRHDDLSC